MVLRLWLDITLYNSFIAPNRAILPFLGVSANNYNPAIAPFDRVKQCVDAYRLVIRHRLPYFRLLT
ncbi:hypothetical protein [uncultured Nostoc sp.]|uniref:hypothetical protein n=1 Tax=uncultured Nostoc sp. TaxID=340711 RepID=UPI0035CA94DD